MSNHTCVREKENIVDVIIVVWILIVTAAEVRSSLASRPAPSFQNWLPTSSDPQQVYSGLRDVSEQLQEHRVMNSSSKSTTSATLRSLRMRLAGLGINEDDN